MFDPGPAPRSGASFPRPPLFKQVCAALPVSSIWLNAALVTSRTRQVPGVADSAKCLDAGIVVGHVDLLFPSPCRLPRPRPRQSPRPTDFEVAATATLAGANQPFSGRATGRDAASGGVPPQSSSVCRTERAGHRRRPEPDAGARRVPCRRHMATSSRRGAIDEYTSTASSEVRDYRTCD